MAAFCLTTLVVWAVSTRWRVGVSVKGSFGIFTAFVYHGVVHVDLDRKIHYYNYKTEWTSLPTDFGLTRPWGENSGFAFEPF